MQYSCLFNVFMLQIILFYYFLCVLFILSFPFIFLLLSKGIGELAKQARHYHGVKIQAVVINFV